MVHATEAACTRAPKLSRYFAKTTLATTHPWRNPRGPALRAPADVRRGTSPQAMPDISRSAGRIWRDSVVAARGGCALRADGARAASREFRRGLPAADKMEADESWTTDAAEAADCGSFEPDRHWQRQGRSG